MAIASEARERPGQDIIDEFCDALWLEDGLSKNTLDAYKRDLLLFAEWLHQQHHLPPVTATSTHLYNSLPIKSVKLALIPQTYQHSPSTSASPLPPQQDNSSSVLFFHIFRTLFNSPH